MSGSTDRAVLSHQDRRAALLRIDPALFRDHFVRRPFYIGHQLTDHPLFGLDRLVKLSRQLPEQCVEYNAGDVPIGLDPRKTPRTGLSVQETIRRIEDNRSWLVLKNVEKVADYGSLLGRCLNEVRPFSEAIDPGMYQPEGFIFISSPEAVTPCHIDPEHNFLLQVRGHKVVHMVDRADRVVLSERKLEEFYGGGHRNLVFRPEYAARAQTLELTPGCGLYFPVTAPHWVKNGADVSISFSITFRTPAVELRQLLYFVNHQLRRCGWRPAPPGRSCLGDRAKLCAFRTARHVWRLLRPSRR
jgi:hypothetical protein